MEYQEFNNEIENYYNLYKKGLKKQANKYIENFVREFEAIDELEKDEILYHFVCDLCDRDIYDYLKERGNGKIPYALNQCVRDWLYKCCLDEKMPELRWFYELYYNDAFGVECAGEFLEKAYAGRECDAKTVNLLFASWIDILGWGAHHFPDCCIISDEARDNAFTQCRKIMGEKTVDEKLQAELKYYETLYSCYNNYCAGGRKKNFQQYCDEANLKFYECEAYYYN